MDILTNLKTWNSREHTDMGTDFPTSSSRLTADTTARREIRRAQGVRFEGHEEAEATAFVTGRPVAGQFITVKGWKVRVGGDFLTEKQAKWIIDIATTRIGVTDEMLASLRVRLEQGFAKYGASQFITKYKDLERTPSASAMEAIAPGASTEEYVRATRPSAVADGRYAIQMEDQDKPHFYVVKAGWKPGVVFVDEQASDDRYPVRNRSQREAILAEIAKDPEAAGLRYATDLGSCRKCGRTLTDHNNPYFASGLGPECGKK